MDSTERDVIERRDKDLARHRKAELALDVLRVSPPPLADSADDVTDAARAVLLAYLKP